MGDTLEAMMRAEDEEEEDDGHEKIFFFFFLFFGLCCESRRQVMLRPQRFAGDRVRSSGFVAIFRVCAEARDKARRCCWREIVANQTTTPKPIRTRKHCGWGEVRKSTSIINGRTNKIEF